MKVAACFTKASVDCHDSVRKMVRAQKLYPGQHDASFAVSGGAVGYVTTGERFSSIPMVRQSSTGNVLLISGTPITMDGGLDGQLARLVEGDYLEAVEILKKFDGAFAAVFWDAQHKKLVIVTDILGLQPLYLARQKGRLLLASELKAFPAGGLVDVAMDPAGWGAFLGLSFNLGNRTQLAGVQWAEPATVMIYDSVSDTLDKSTYWTWPEPKRNITFNEIDTGQMLDIMRQEMEGYAAHGRDATILLSGGFDSRLILSLLHQARIDARALILSHREELLGLDGQLARRLARQMGVKHIEVIDSPDNFYSTSAYLRYLVMNEVAIPSLSLFIARVAEHVTSDRHAVWEGVGPGFGFAPAYPRPGGFEAYLQDRCLPKDSLHWQAASSVFSAGLSGNFYDRFQELLAQEIAQYPDDEFGVARFQMRNQMAHRLALNPLKVLANQVMPYTPAISKAFWDMAVGIPLEMTEKGKLYLELFRRHFPAALKLPICSGGKLLNAGSYHPSFWMRKQFCRLSSQSRYYYGRINNLPAVGPLLGKLGLSPERRTENLLVNRVIRAVRPDHPDLNADTIMRLKKEKPPYDWNTKLSRSMLFYWQIWRWIMQGDLNVENSDTFLTEMEHS